MPAAFDSAGGQLRVVERRLAGARLGIDEDELPRPALEVVAIPEAGVVGEPVRDPVLVHARRRAAAAELLPFLLLFLLLGRGGVVRPGGAGGADQQGREQQGRANEARHAISLGDAARPGRGRYGARRVGPAYFAGLSSFTSQVHRRPATFHAGPVIRPSFRVPTWVE